MSLTVYACKHDLFDFMAMNTLSERDTPFSLTEMAMSVVNRKKHDLRCARVPVGIIKTLLVLGNVLPAGEERSHL